jgi:hypothetical protein
LRFTSFFQSFSVVRGRSQKFQIHVSRMTESARAMR